MTTTSMRTILSSRGRDWRGLSAALVAMPAGAIEAGPAEQHLLSFHIGAPVRVACRVDDGPVWRRLQSHGDVDVVPAGCDGRWVDEAPCTALLLRLHHDLLRETAEGMDIDPDRATLVPRQRLQDPRLTHIAWALRAELESDAPGDPLYAESLATALAAHLLRLPSQLAVGEQIGGLAPRQCKRVLDYIEANLDRDLTLAALSQVAGVSISHFKAMFRRSLGIPVHQYVIGRRVEHAKQLLLEGSLPLSQIAIQAGFAHQSHMARCMRRVLGVAPRRVRSAGR